MPLNIGFRLLILLMLASFPAVGTVLFTPALPIIATYFKVETGVAQLSVTFYLIGFALGQLPYGPLANRFGRLPSLWGGLILSAIGALLCVLAGFLQTFTLLLIARFVMAMGAAAGLKLSFTMVGDLYGPPHSTKVFSKLILAFAIMPGVATSIGGFLTHHFGWASCFYFLAAYSILLLVLSTTFTETLKRVDQSDLNLKNISEGYLEALQNHKLVICAIILGLRTSFIYVFATKAPFIGLHVIGLDPEQFGFLSLIPPVGMLLGTIITLRLAGSFKEVSIILTGLIIAIFGTLTMLTTFFAGALSIWSLFIPMFIIDVGLSLIYANASSLGLHKAKNISNGSAMLNFINLGLSVLMVLAIESYRADTPWTMPVLFSLLLALMALSWTRLNKILK